MKYDENRIHHLKKEYVGKLANSKSLNSLCEQVWIFGSTVDGCSIKKHTPFSDIDIAILSLNDDLTDNINNLIYKEIYSILHPKVSYDIIWINKLQDNNDKILSEIKKGVRII